MATTTISSNFASSCFLVSTAVLLLARGVTTALSLTDAAPTAAETADTADTANLTLYNSTVDNTSSVLADQPDTKYSTLSIVILTIFFLILIVGTVVGNILVCVAVCLVRKLRRPSNYLVVSLAVSDLCVALLVMPISMAYELIGSWPFGFIMCDVWVSFDVLCCTASILNLCMISVDRYYAITKPLEYGVKRTPRRMLFCVLLVWVGSAFISLPPLLIMGNIKTETSCSVSQNSAYQVYATFGSFYLPLTVMVTVYFKIFGAARRIVKDEKKAQSHLETHCYLEINVKNGGGAEAKLLGNQNSRGEQLARGSTASTNTTCSVGGGGGGGGADKTDSGISRCFATRKSSASQCPMLAAQGPGAQGTTTQGAHGRRPSRLQPSQGTTAPQPGSSQTKKRRQSHEHTTSNRIRNSFSHFASKSPFGMSHSPHQKKLRFQLAKERKASTTLGIIMSAFIICWLPFFVLALIRPFLGPNAVPDSVSALFLWLGYVNSLLNPIIYATLNRDFRKPFQEILFFRCSNLNNMMREEFYHSQYGDPEQHYCVNHNSKLNNYEEGVEIVSGVGRSEPRTSESFL